jgi:hypothetical protein
LISDSNDRAVAITAAAILETTLEMAIRFRLARIKARNLDEIFIGDSPLSTFSAKIKIADCLQLIGPKTRADFDVIKEIRNAFAHSRIILQFSTNQVAAVCSRLTLHQADSFLDQIRNIEHSNLIIQRIRFLTACSYYSVMLDVLSTPGNHQSARRFLSR